jgi:hypothetical protein
VAGECNLVYRDSIFEKLVLSGGQCEEGRAIQLRLYSYNLAADEFDLESSMYEWATVNSRSAYYRIGTNSYFSDSLYTGTCNLLKFDTINNIASCTFEFTGYNKGDSTIVNITDGRFDIKFKDYR